MTQEQQGIAEEFQNVIEAEYALCVGKIIKISQSIANNGVHEKNKWSGTDCANLQIHSIQKYWENRLYCFIDFIERQDYKLNEKLAMKHLARVTPEEENATD